MEYLVFTVIDNNRIYQGGFPTASQAAVAARHWHAQGVTCRVIEINQDKKDVQTLWYQGKSLSQIESALGFLIQAPGPIASLHKDIMDGDFEIHSRE